MRKGLATDFFAPGRPRVIAHRGAGGDYPENTLPAFGAALAAGAPYIELDVHCARDGEVVVAHDADLRRIAGDDGVIAEMALAELRAVDAARNFSPDGSTFPFRGQGIRVPMLAEVLTAFPMGLFVVEFKPEDAVIADATLEVVKSARMTRRVLFASEHLAPIMQVRALAPELPTNLPAAEIGAFMQSLPEGAIHYQPVGDTLQIPPEYHGWKLVSADSVARAHQSGIEVHVWTVNKPAEMRAMLAFGVDGIITDYPSRLRAVIARA